jgi:hypothetical protein
MWARISDISKGRSRIRIKEKIGEREIIGGVGKCDFVGVESCSG